MREWNNPYNPFNSMKALIWREWFEGIIKGEFLPPITVDTDPTNKCNYKCIWCNAFDYMHGDIKKQSLPEEHLIELADFYKEWGVRSTCIAGGGEPLLNPGLLSFIKRLHKNNIESGIITNGSLLTDDLIDNISMLSRWCGISVDAASPKTYALVKGIKNENLFIKVIENIEKLAERSRYYGNKCDIAYKYLVHPINAHEIYPAACLAKSIGVRDFHLRPVGWDNLTITQDKGPINFNALMDEINLQCQQALTLEDENFKFYGVRHKFNPNMTKKVNFEKCRATPLLTTFGADGNCHLCFDMRGRKDLILCSHQPNVKNILNYWGGSWHKELINRIDIKDCPRCTFGPYNEIIEQVFIKDKMCRYFP